VSAVSIARGIRFAVSLGANDRRLLKQRAGVRDRQIKRSFPPPILYYQVASVLQRILTGHAPISRCRGYSHLAKERPKGNLHTFSLGPAGDLAFQVEVNDKFQGFMKNLRSGFLLSGAMRLRPQS